ncbi:MAG: NAD(P)-binding protein, partial [Geminicoccaceae bacterium]
MDDRYDILFEPVKIGPVTAPNRFYAVPHATGHGWSQPQGSIALRSMKAEGGWGTVAVQMTEIAPDSDMANHPMDRLWDERDLPMHAAQVVAIKKHGALAALELAHGGMRARNYTTGLPVPGPSNLPILRPEVPIQARAMDLADIRAFRVAHKAAAMNAKKAGYDILYVYAAHDLSLLSHFLSLRTNQRNDAYGGSLDNRMRLLREVLEDTLEVASGDCAVALRFSVAEPGKAVGLTHDGEGRDVVEALAALPDLWDVNISGWPEDSATSRFADEGFQLPFTDFVKSVTSKPVVGVGRFTSPDLMVSLVRKKRLDLIGAARPSIADPFLPTKILEGRTDEIRECIGCNICVSMDGYGVPLRCTQNPTIAEEWRRNWHPEIVPITLHRQSYLVVGAGPAGLECAWTLLRAGHQVTIAEARSDPGGRVTLEAALPGLGAWGRVRDHRVYQMQQRADAELYLSSPMTSDDIAGFEADGIVVATGCRWRNDGVGSANLSPLALGDDVLTPDDVMDGLELPVTPEPVIVYDDDHFYMASVIVEKLAKDGHQVVYVTPLPTVATWTDLTLEQARIIERLNDLGVALHVNVKMGKTRRFTNTLTGAAIDLPAAQLIMVGARQPCDGLYTSLK